MVSTVKVFGGKRYSLAKTYRTRDYYTARPAEVRRLAMAVAADERKRGHKARVVVDDWGKTFHVYVFK